ncbi:MAG TPA: efflux RND transporter periplasmic adaptor subunit [Rhizomicrobium sp.]|nr:efflux RND transporter periplasmic adaptor subunit [Rhizomicrobium sp.]
MTKRTKYIIAAVVVAIGGVAAWLIFSGPSLPPGFAGGNGRLEATEYFISTKYPGRIKDVLFNEGDTVNPGQVVAHMDTSALDEQLREAEAQAKVAQDGRNVALAQVNVKQAAFDYANKEYLRSRSLVPKGAVSQQEAEIDQARMLASRAELAAAKVQVVQAEGNIEAAKAAADKFRAQIKDATLVSPIRARIQTRLAEPGEVLAAGGRVFSVNDLSDVYMYVYLPESVTGKIPLGSPARVVLDAAPQYPIRTYVSFISPVAQFTPKTVETAEERHNLTFRVKLQLDKNRLREWEPLVKVGLPGMGYVRWKEHKEWPERLQARAVPPNIWQPTGSYGGEK